MNNTKSTFVHTGKPDLQQAMKEVPFAEKITVKMKRIKYLMSMEDSQNENTFLVNGNSGLGLALKEVSFAEIKKPDYLSLCRLIYAWSEDQRNRSCCVQKNKKGSYKECSKEKASQKLSSSQLILKWKSP